MSDDLTGGQGVHASIVAIAFIFSMAPFVTGHDVKVLGLQEVLIILSVCRVGQVVLLLIRVTAVAIIEVGGSPSCVVCLLLTVGPVAAGIHVNAQVFETVNLVVHLNVTHVVERVGTVVLLIQTRQRVCHCIAVPHCGIEGVV